MRMHAFERLSSLESLYLSNGHGLADRSPWIIRVELRPRTLGANCDPPSIRNFAGSEAFSCGRKDPPALSRRAYLRAHG